MPSYHRPRNNYSSRAGIQPFSGLGRTLGGRNRSSLMMRAANLLGAAATVAAPLAASVVPGVRGLKRKFAKGSQSTAKKTKVGEQDAVPFGLAGPGSQSEYRFPAAKSQKFKCPQGIPVGRQVFVKNGTTSATSTEAQQAVNDICSIFNTTDLTSIGAGTIGSTYTSERKVYLQYATGEIMFTNPTNSTMRLKIHHAVPKKDLNSATVNTPGVMLNNVLADEALIGAGGAGTATDINAVGFRPQDVEAFRQYYYVTETVDLLLEAGQVHVHRFQFQVNRELDTEEYKYQSGGLKELSRFIFAQFYGMPEFATANHALVSVCQSRLISVFNVSYHFKYFEASPVGYKITNALTTQTNPLIVEHVLDATAAPTI